LSTTKIPQVIQLSEWHKSRGQLGRFGLRMGTAYSARKTTAAIISGHSAARSQCRARIAPFQLPLPPRLVVRLSKSDINECAGVATSDEWQR